MKSFLEELSEAIYAKHHDHLADLMVIFPNRRAGFFFRQYLAKHIQHPVWSPEIMSFEDFVHKQVPLLLADPLTLIFTLFDIFKAESPFKESFDRFYFWGELLLSDFNEIDKYLVDAEDIFTNIKDLKELEDNYAYLTTEQLAAIAKFWKSFELDQEALLREETGTARLKFLKLWEILYPVYRQFKIKLESKGLGYDGMITRKLVKLLESEQTGTTTFDIKNREIVFAGFNALATAEEKIISWFITHQQAEIYWDVDGLYMNNNHHEAGLFLRKYIQKKPFFESLKPPYPEHFTTGTDRTITLTGVTLEVGQAKKLGEILETLCQQDNFNPEKTVIVLPQEHMLFPVLHALPASINKINVTMGYQLRDTSLYSLLEHLLTLQQNARIDQNGHISFHYSSVLSVLRHPYVIYFNTELAIRNAHKIESENRVYIAADELEKDSYFYPAIFRQVSSAIEMFDYLLDLLKLINKHYQEVTPDQNDLPENQLDIFQQENTEEHPWLEQEYIYHFYIHLNRLKSVLEKESIDLTLTTFLRLFRQIMQSLRLPFTGEPLRGLQIMGMLETRNLDFENVFILSMNEGIFPAQNNLNSFIPHNLRFGFGLPSFDQQDAIYANIFYRLLQRAKNAYLFYNTEDTPNLSGEMSRFLYQLIYESEVKDKGILRFPAKKGAFRVVHQTLANPVHSFTPKIISIPKDEKVMQVLEKYLVKNGNSEYRLTPSALNTYLDCRLRFYYQYIAGLEQTDEVKEEVDALIFGNILHKVMETIYQEHLKGNKTRIIRAEDFTKFKGKYLDWAIEEGFKAYFKIKEGNRFHFEGRNVIVREIVKKMVVKILDMDETYAPFEIVGLEQRGYYLEASIRVNKQENHVVGLKGIIDRIDKKENEVRVLDYKTGKDEKHIPNIASLFDRADVKRNKAGMQAIFYGLLYREKFPDSAETITPGLLNAKELFKNDFDFYLKLDKKPLFSLDEYLPEFRQYLVQLLEEIFDSNIPLDQTTDIKKCKNCPYESICW